MVRLCINLLLCRMMSMEKNYIEQVQKSVTDAVIQDGLTLNKHLGSNKITNLRHKKHFMSNKYY